MAADLLFEIGTEEIPAGFLPPALNQLAALAVEGRILRPDGSTPIAGAAVYVITTAGDSIQVTFSGMDGTYRLYHLTEDFTVFTQPLSHSAQQSVNDNTTPPPRFSLPMAHLSVPDAERIITELKPKVAILTHFGMSMWRAKPWQIAESLSQQTGVRVLAARDGMRFDLSQLDNS